MSGSINKTVSIPFSLQNQGPIYWFHQNGIDNGSLKGRVSSDYHTQRCRTTSYARYTYDHTTFSIGCNMSSPWGVLGFNADPRVDFLRNQAYERFRDKATGPRSAIGTAIAEWRQTLGLVVDLAVEARQHWLAFRRNRYARFLDTRINPSAPRGRLHNEALRASDAWLTWWFGISPILGDITNACQLMTQPFPKAKRYFGRSKMRFLDRYASWHVREGEISVSTGARVKLVNPNLYLANQLGLVNPVSIAWEIVPFSFVADWAFDISSFFESFTDFVGMELSMPYTAYKIEGSTSRTNAPGTYGKWSASQFEYRRFKTLIRPTPNTQIRANLGSSLTRAASAVALILQRTR